MDRKREQIERYQYEFEGNGISTAGLARTAAEVAPPSPRDPSPIVSDHTQQEYMDMVEAVRAGMKQGD